jgi:hypothetical protein
MLFPIAPSRTSHYLYNEQMRIILVRAVMAIRRLTCRIFGHVEANVSLRTVGLKQCRRCLRITAQKTARARVTRGEIEQRMAAHPPEGYSFVDCNWKKRKARFVSEVGGLEFITF